MTALHAWTLSEAAQAFARGETTARALLEACLARIAAFDGRVHAIMRLDADAARERAAALDAARARGEKLGPLAGVPMLHKDMFYRAGQVSTCGSAIRRGFVAERTATVLARLDAAGAVDAGTLQMAEFAQSPTGHNGPFGDVMNPWHPAYVSGGSSSGSGAVVAAGFAFAALGSDTGGSIRLPAACCGVTGLKPTQTRVPRTGAMPLSFSCDNLGPLVRSARDAALMLGVLAGRDEDDPTSAREPVPDYLAALTGDISGQRIAVIETLFCDGLDDETARLFEASLEVLRDRGAIIERIAVPLMHDIQAATAMVSRAEAAAIHAAWMRERPQDYAPHLAARLYGGYAVPAHLYIEALALRGPLLRAFAEAAFAQHDLIATPTLHGPVPTRAETDVDADAANWARLQAVSQSTRGFNYLGLPAISIPAGFDARGLPFGLQLAARPFGEARLLRAADAFQRATDWHRRLPF
jgi:aspartyl-tRNA(Asn)/glutamyl-tRNA(Gln) amidotransferase subunit A